jgi:NTP pyrophosphatase (non-canonical NTP hydrolase)
MIRLEEIFEEIRDEIIRAEAHGPIFNSLHEAYAIIAEELDELWDITRQKRKNRSREEMHRELVQIAAMAIKALRSMQNFGGKEVRDSVTPSTQAQDKVYRPVPLETRLWKQSLDYDPEDTPNIP